MSAGVPTETRSSCGSRAMRSARSVATKGQTSGVSEQDDVRFMRRALRLAARAAGRTSPNPLVGTVIVRGDEIVGEGYHHAAGQPHAEVNAIREARIARVVAAMRDPDPRTDGKGFRALRGAGIEVTQGVLEAEAERLNEGFVSRVKRGRPFVLVKLATTVDGRVAVRGRRYLSGKAALKEVHRLRDRYDAVLVGIGTVLADDPALTVRETRGRDPLRVIVDTDARTPTTAKVVRARDVQRTIIFVARDADVRRVKRLRDTGALVTALPRSDGGLDLAAVLRWLAEQGVNTVLSEAGPHVAGTLLRSGLADRLMLITSPIAGGDGPVALDGLAAPVELRALRTRKMGDDVAIEGDL